jgi:ribosome-binding factor A
MRHSPSIEFFHDALPETARAIDDVLDRARASDEAVAAVRAGATYAGEADPYKKPRVEDESDDLDDDEDS